MVMRIWTVDLEFTDEPAMLRSNVVHGINKMPCQLTPGRVS